MELATHPSPGDSDSPLNALYLRKAKAEGKPTRYQKIGAERKYDTKTTGKRDPIATSETFQRYPLALERLRNPPLCSLPISPSFSSSAAPARKTGHTTGNGHA